MQPMSSRLRIVIGAGAISCVVALSLLLTLHAGVRGLVLDPFVNGINSARYTLGYMSQGLQWLIVVLVALIAIIGLVILLNRGEGEPDIAASSTIGRCGTSHG